ncbi:MAG: bifunctional 4-hydroxy-2-oxoglutarate aldolase/2-dehydro-3-deoxy-phosphogluconate aldolase [Erysipelotrichaceae bacterium]|nr:bifunctional 4-hydroxy-2-oxoglutarate aldolase/2-dehydro-3-deoxy-phosphogluconate aldolase [Erysipelotrichaceae bacterium]
MNQEELIQEIKKEKIIAIIRGASLEKCSKVVEALYKGGIRFAEITYNQAKPETWEDTACLIGKLVEEFKGRVHIGAGTVTNTKLVYLTHKNHGEYIISPDTNVEVIKRTKEFGMISMPGALTPSEVLTAYNAGADFVKLFPIGCFSPAYVKALRAPINHVPLLAVGGVNEKNIKEYFEAGCVGAGIGGNLAKKEWIESGEYDKLTEAAIKLLEAIKE